MALILTAWLVWCFIFLKFTDLGYILRGLLGFINSSVASMNLFASCVVLFVLVCLSVLDALFMYCVSLVGFWLLGYFCWFWFNCLYFGVCTIVVVFSFACFVIYCLLCNLVYSDAGISLVLCLVLFTFGFRCGFNGLLGCFDFYTCCVWLVYIYL